MTKKLLLCCILKDDSEYEIASRMLASFMPYMSGLCVALTGVSGNFSKLKELITSYSGQFVECTPKTHPELYSPLASGGYFFSNFAGARNISFELASKMQEKTVYDFWTWADVDDLLVSGEELDKVATIAQERNTDAVYFTYWYSVVVREDGTFDESCVNIEHIRERLIKPNVFKWISRLHEVSVPKDGHYQPRLEMYLFDPKNNQHTVWAHITDQERVLGAMERNTQILEIQSREEMEKQGKHDPRTVFYLAKTYFDRSRVENKPEYLQLCDLLLDEYLYGENPSGWSEERSNALEYKAQIHINYALAAKSEDDRIKQHRSAITLLHEAIKEYPIARHMTYLLLAQEYAEIGMNDESDFWLDIALKLDAPQARTTIGNPLEIKLKAASLKYNQHMRKSEIKDALYWLKIRNQILNVTDDKLEQVLSDSIMLNEAGMWVWNYAKWLKDTGHKDQIRPLLQSLPLELGREQFAHYIANEVAEPKVWGMDTIVYFASFGGEHFEQWSGKSVTRGIGGSETAVIRLAEEWVKAGYKVTVFCDPREEMGLHNGVDYRPWYEMNWKDTFNILILWRSPHLLNREIHARKLFMDLHDVVSALDYTPERIAMLDKVFFKTEYHRKMIPQLPEEKVAIISNGI